MAPSGKVIVNNEVYDAVSLHGTFIDTDTTVRIHDYRNNQLYVTPIDNTSKQ